MDIGTATLIMSVVVIAANGVAAWSQNSGRHRLRLEVVKEIAALRIAMSDTVGNLRERMAVIESTHSIVRMKERAMKP